ncbi:MAG: TetR/AcrR family transcriptional regulator [Acidobacteriaceae bacterium]|nr:TetR/AcrR family transcriptional regulator [Acidobacteriaceae bacterium]
MPAKPKSRRQVLTEFRRAEILDAALKLFGKKGFAQTRMEDIAEQAGLAKGTLYLYFSSKDAMYEAAVQRAIAQQTEQGAEAIEKIQGVAARLRAFLTFRMSFWISYPDLYRLLATLGRERRFRKQTHTIVRASVEEMIDILAAGVRDGELADRDYTSLAWALMDMVRGMNERRMYGESTRSSEQDAEAILAMVLPYIGVNAKLAKR